MGTRAIPPALAGLGAWFTVLPAEATQVAASLENRKALIPSRQAEPLPRRLPQPLHPRQAGRPADPKRSENKPIYLGRTHIRW